MSIKKDNLHQDLKTALMLKGSNLTRFARTLEKPDGSIGVSHTAVIRVAQNHEKTDWIRQEIQKVIRTSRRRFPEFWKQKMGA